MTSVSYTHLDVYKRQVHVCADLPFGSYQVSPSEAKRNVSRLVAETGCQSVKLEGGQPWYCLLYTSYL